MIIRFGFKFQEFILDTPLLWISEVGTGIERMNQFIYS
jgi:hypothetical protein